MLSPSAVHVSMRKVKCVRVFSVFFTATAPCPIFLLLALHRWRCRVLQLEPGCHVPVAFPAILGFTNDASDLSEA